jgi:hypothetical protein
MKKSLLFLLFVCSMYVLNACSGGSSAPPPPPSIMTTQSQLTAAPAIAGTSYSVTFQAAGSGTLTWGSVGLPADNLTLNPATGTVSGTPAAKANVAFTLSVSDTLGHSSPASQFTITVNNPPPPAITTTQSQLAAASPQVGNSYGFSFTASGGLAPLTWTESGALPSSFTLSADGSLSGTATATGTFQFNLTVQDAAAQKSAAQNFTLTVTNPPPPVINTSPAPTLGFVNQFYSFTFTATAGLAPFTWTESNALPPGLTCCNGGILSGTPTMTGSFPISVVVQDSLGRTAAPQNFNIQIAQSFSSTGSMETSRAFHSATLLNDGRVLVAGGQSAPLVSSSALASAELYDPVSGNFSPTGSLNAARTQQTATLLLNGMVLVAGGRDSSGNALATAELFDPAAGSFSPTGSMANARFSHTATLLNDGRVLVTGGSATASKILASAELYDPSTQKFAPVAVPMETPRAGHTATLLKTGKVLLAGGSDPAGPLATAELFDSSSQTFVPTTGNMTVTRTEHTATLLQDGTVLIQGSANQAAELFDPNHGSFAPTGTLTYAPFRLLSTATLRSDGTVLVAGGDYEVGQGAPDCTVQLHQSVAATSLFDPASGSFTPAGNLSPGRTAHTATLLQDGHVIVTGGILWNIKFPVDPHTCSALEVQVEASAELFP